MFIDGTVECASRAIECGSDTGAVPGAGIQAVINNDSSPLLRDGQKGAFVGDIDLDTKSSTTHRWSRAIYVGRGIRGARSFAVFQLQGRVKHDAEIRSREPGEAIFR